MKTLYLMLCAWALAACTQMPSTVPDHEAVTPQMACQEPRPEMRTRDYRPVCATRDSGIRCVTTPCPSTELKTYSNACSACSDVQVMGFTQGPCATH